MKSAVDSLLLDSLGQKIRQWLAAPNPDSNADRARELRHEGTGIWLFEIKAFQKWISGTYRHLWLYGKPGCGKTILSTTILDHLEKDDSLFVLSFFFDFGDAMKQTRSGMLRSFAPQLYQGGRDSAGYLHTSFRAHDDGDKRFSTRTLEQAIRVILGAQQRVAIVLDALDESKERDQILLWIGDMFSTRELHHVQIIYTSREEPEFIRGIPDLIGDQCCFSVDKAAIDVDIRSYVMARIQSDPGFTKKELSGYLLDQIDVKVGQGARGMFRWAVCQLDSIAKCLSPRALERELGKFPTTLEQTYDRMLQSIPQDYLESAVRLLQFVVYAKRPLTLKEVVDVVAVDISDDHPGFDTSCRMFDDIDIMRHCPSLLSIVKVHKKTETVQELHLAHFSVKEYLLRQRDFRRAEVSIVITKTCLIYLKDVKGYQWKFAENSPLASYAAQVWMEFAVIAETCEEVLAMIVAFLQQKEGFQRWIDLYEGKWKVTRHLGIFKASSLYYACVGGLIEVTRSIMDEEVDINAQQGYFGNALQAASCYGHLELVQLLLDKNADVNAQGGKYGNALQSASYGGHFDVVRLLLDAHAFVNARGGEWGNALHAASYNGHLNVVQLLLERRADVNAKGGRHGNALTAASYLGHMKIVELLLSHGAEVHSEGGYKGNALEAASYSGHLDIVQLLLRKEINREPSSRFYENALKAACEGGCLDVVQLLLDKGVDINTYDDASGHALQAAVCGGNEKIVKLLVDCGADLNATGGEFGSALQAACWLGYANILETLIELGADVNAKGAGHDSSVHIACRQGNKRIFNILRRSDADIGSLVENYDKMLHEACENGGADVVKLLATLGPQLVCDSDLDHCLQIACLMGHRDVIECLVGMGANLNARCGPYGSPLQSACAGENKEVIELLIKLGLEVKTEGQLCDALHAAASRGSHGLVEMLLDLGADANACESGTIDSTNALFEASHNGHWNIVRTLLRSGAEASISDKFGRTPLYAASSNGHGRIAKLLIEAGADINAAAYKCAWTPVIAASSNGHVHVLELLIRRGASISATDENGFMPLHVASSKGHFEVVNLLLDIGGIHPYCKDLIYGRTALSYAAQEGHLSVVKLLLANPRGKVDSRDSVGRTALSHASRKGMIEVVKILLKSHAAVDMPDCYGSTPLSIAARRGHTVVVEMLLAAGANRIFKDRFHRTPLWWALRRGGTETVRILGQDENQHGVGLNDTISLGFHMRRHHSFDRYCDICTLNVSYNCTYYACPKCNGGDFDICENCFVLGGRCLDEAHTLISESSQYIVEVDTES